MRMLQTMRTVLQGRSADYTQRSRRGLWVLLVLLGAWAPAVASVTIYPAQKGVQINRFFYDFKSPGAPKNFNEAWARTLLIDYGFNGIRTSIYGDDKRPAHPKPGVLLEQYYENETKGLKLAKRVRPDTIIFASKKLDGKTSFPAWTKDHQGVIPKQYALLLIDYLEYMKREGLRVDVLGIDNERRFNEGNIMPRMHREIVEELRRLTSERGIHMPLIVGHEDFSMGRNDWMGEFNRVGGDTMDIFAGHYYPNARLLDRLKSDLEQAGEREKWHTELHWDKKDQLTQMEEAVAALLALWDCTDNGMNGLMWWAFGPRRNFRSHLMHAASVPLVGAYPVVVTDPDGAETVEERQLHTRAFLQGDFLTIYALNLDEKKVWEDLSFKLDTGRIVGPIRGRQWAEGYPDKGKSATIQPYSEHVFYSTLAPGTITMFRFKYATR